MLVISKFQRLSYKLLGCGNQLPPAQSNMLLGRNWGCILTICLHLSIEYLSISQGDVGVKLSVRPPGQRERIHAILSHTYTYTLPFINENHIICTTDLQCWHLEENLLWQQVRTDWGSGRGWGPAERAWSGPHPAGAEHPRLGPLMLPRATN